MSWSIYAADGTLVEHGDDDTPAAVPALWTPA